MLALPTRPDADTRAADPCSADAPPADTLTADTAPAGRVARLRQTLQRPDRSDALRVLALTLLTFASSSAFQWQERLAAVSARFERWQADEVPLTLVALSLGLAWYAWRRRAETAVLLARNRELAQWLIDVQERERRELARELHDELAQHCTAIRVEAAYLQGCVDPAQAAAAARRTAETAGLLQQGVRRLLRRLRPAELDELGLADALASLGLAWEGRSGVRCTVRANGRVDAVPDTVATAVYRVVQEAFSNAMRHAAATRVAVVLDVGATALSLHITDDGRGFDPARATRGLGLVGAHERAAALGGRLSVTSAAGTGTGLHLTLPLHAAAARR